MAESIQENPPYNRIVAACLSPYHFRHRNTFGMEKAFFRRNFVKIIFRDYCRLKKMAAIGQPAYKCMQYSKGFCFSGMVY